MKHRSVVANFIFKSSDADEKSQMVALFKRSYHPNIRSYQGKYAPISGSIEDNDTSPVAAAERELREETQLIPHRDLVLEFCGKTFSVVDEQAQRSWTVHPFGWNLQADASEIKIDWEHSGWQWFDPQKVLDKSIEDQCVPDIDNSFQRVYFGPNGMFGKSDHLIGRDNRAGTTFLRTVESLKTNTQDGARTLATEALRGLLNMAVDFRDAASEGTESFECWQALRVAAYHFIHSARPSMNAAIFSTLTTALHKVSQQASNKELDPHLACSVLESRLVSRDNAPRQIGERFGQYVEQATRQFEQTALGSSRDPAQTEHSRSIVNIITISMSGTILTALKALVSNPSVSGLSINLIILESRPQYEGVTLAASLVESLQNTDPNASCSERPTLNIKIVPESHTAHAIFDASTASQHQRVQTIVLLGADRVTPSGHVMNKVGSAQLAQIAAQQAKLERTKVVVLMEEDKIAVPDLQFLDLYSRQAKAEGEASKIQGTSEDPDLTELVRSELESASCLNEPHDVSEVYSTWPKNALDTLLPWIRRDSVVNNIGVEVSNIYFEAVDRQHIDHYITENGELQRRDIVRKSLARAKLGDEVFKDLYD